MKEKAKTVTEGPHTSPETLGPNSSTLNLTSPQLPPPPQRLVPSLTLWYFSCLSLLSRYYSEGASFIVKPYVLYSSYKGRNTKLNNKNRLKLQFIGRGTFFYFFSQA